MNGGMKRLDNGGGGLKVEKEAKLFRGKNRGRGVLRFDREREKVTCKV